MAWLVESFLTENEDVKKAIENHKQEIKNIDDSSKKKIEKINSEAKERIEDNPDNEKKINTIRKMQVNNVRNGAELLKKKHREAISKLEKETKGE